MTEKDAVKSRGVATGDTWYVPVEAVFDGMDGARLLERVERVLRRP
jgi:tetraacyldisaccharide-1-P 4'-kinase